MKNIIKSLILSVVLFTGFLVGSSAYAAEVNLNIRSGDTLVYSEVVTLPDAGDVEIQSKTVNAQSLLSIINTADLASDAFSIDNLQYFDSFGSFYINCITSSQGENCDNWQFVVDAVYPFTSVDQTILSGGETIYLYYGPQNQVVLSSSSINTSDTLYVTAQKYNYELNSWDTRTGVTVGVTQPDEANPFSPIEVYTEAVDSEGKATFASIGAAGDYNIGIKEDYYFPTEALHVDAVVSGGSGGGSSSYVPSYTIAEEKTEVEIETETEVILSGFDTKKALNFVLENQKEDGSFGESLYTDWATIALIASEGINQNELVKLIKFLNSQKLVAPMLTDYERHAMALMALGLNPYNTDGENYIKRITDSYDGKQFGNTDEDNDDIFALLVLRNAGYSIENEMIQNSLDFVFSKQKENGSWDESVDMTGAALQMLAQYENEKAKTAIEKALEFLKNKQEETGGWGNASSTAWAIQGLQATGRDHTTWTKSEKTPQDFFLSIQDKDGGIKGENLKTRIWETSYVLASLSGKTWSEIMTKYERPLEELVDEKVNEKLDIILSQIKRQQSKAVTTTKIDTQPPVNNVGIVLNKNNTASTINALPTTDTNKNQPAKSGWLGKIFKTIFSIF